MSYTGSDNTNGAVGRPRHEEGRAGGGAENKSYTGNGNFNGTVGVGTRSRSRRALIGLFSDEDEEGDDNPHQQPPLMKGKTPPLPRL